MIKSIKTCILNIIPKEHCWKIVLLENWENIIGDLKKTVTIEQINEDVLLLGVIHPAWAQEILALTPILKQKINNFLGKEYIKIIRIKLRKIKKNEEIKKQTDASQTILQTALSIKEIESLSKIKDEDLRKIMQNFCLKCRSRKL